MSTSTPASPTLLFFFLLLVARPPPSNGFSYFQYRIVFSLTHSLMMRGATLRASRGDHSGADRARSIAKMIGKVGGLGIWRQMPSISWDYMKNYSWEDMSFNDMNELRLFLKELTQIESNLVQKKVVDGGLLWDCLEVGRGDSKGLMQIVKDVAEQFSSSYASRGDHSGADRTRSIAKMIGKVGGLGLCRLMWSIGSDYVKNYPWIDTSPTDMFGGFKDYERGDVEM